MKVLIVGFDGATWDLINRFDLPNFRKLMKKGVTATMKSTYPPVTIPAWPCMFSGYNPGKIGAVDFYRREKNNSFKLVGSNVWRGKLLWDRLKNLKFLVLNIPFTYPPYKINGDIVSIDFSPSKGYTYPPELEEELEMRFKVSSIWNSKNGGLDALYEKEKKVLEIFKYLTRKNDYDVAIVRFGIPDQVTHKTTRFKDIRRCHYFMDELLGDVIKNTEFEYLFIVSDHGVKKSEKKFCINTWLYRKGYLSLTLKGKIYFILRNLYEKLLFKKFRKQLKAMIRYLNKSKLNRHNKIPIPGMPKKVLNVIDYKKSSAFGFLSNSLKQSPIYLQIDKSNPEYKSLLRKLSQELLAIRDDKGERVVNNVFTKKELYSGEHIDNMPDMVVESNMSVFTVLLPDMFPEINSYTHTMDGIFLVFGKGTKKNTKLANVKIYDITPTILHILGFPIPRDFDGRVLTEIFDKNYKLAKLEPIFGEYRYYGNKKFLKKKIKKIKRKL